jgi:hypothetical protein
MIADKIIMYSKAGQSGLVVTSYEPEIVLGELERALRSKLQVADNEAIPLVSWDLALGLSEVRRGTTYQQISLHEFLQNLLREELTKAENLEYSSIANFVYIKNFDRMLFPMGTQGPVDSMLLATVQHLVMVGQETGLVLLMQTMPDFELPPELVAHCDYVHHELPHAEERNALVTELLSQNNIEVPNNINEATAGLTRAKTVQYTAEVVAEFGEAKPEVIFKKKAEHLAKASKLNVWSPAFVSNIRLWPVPELEEFRDAKSLVMTEEKHLPGGEVRAKVKYMSAEGANQEKWLEPMPLAEFESQFRPERDFYSYKSIVGLNGLKEVMTRGLRKDIPDRARMKHVLMLGVPGTGKSFTMECSSGQFGLPLTTMQASNLYSKWLGDTDKILQQMLQTAEKIGGILAIDEFQRFLPQGNSGESGGVENRLLGSLLTWFNNQNSNLVLSAANNISNLPDEITRSGRVDILFFVGFPGRESKDAAWDMYIKRHELPEQELPKDDWWTPADIMSCCRLAELQGVPVKTAAMWITPSYEKNQTQMDELMNWAENAGCICAETGLRFKHPRKAELKSAKSKVTRHIKA